MDAPIDNVKGAVARPRRPAAWRGIVNTFCERHLRLKVFGVQTSRDDDGNAAANIGPGSEKISEEQARDASNPVEEVGNEVLAFWADSRIWRARYLDPLPGRCGSD